MIEEQVVRSKSKNLKCRICQNKKQIANDKVILIFTHNEKNPPIHQWFRQCRKILERNEKGKVMGKSVQIVYTQAKSLKKLVVGQKVEGMEGAELFLMRGVLNARQSAMPVQLWLKVELSKAQHTRKTYQIKQQVNYQSPFIVYLGTCQKCHGQYVGKSTQPFPRRHSIHKQEVNNKIGRLGQHYGGNQGCCYKNL